MCQLTYLNGDSVIAKAYLLNLTVNNASDGNKDGHGFFVLPSELISRTKDDGRIAVCRMEYYKRLDEAVKDLKRFSVISHVRAASRGYEVKAENSHPFRKDNLVLAHNGTLDAESIKFEVKDKIDSYWFLDNLASIVNKRPLEAEHIVAAMKNFRGKFAFLIYDNLQKDTIWVVKGKAPLCYTRMHIGDNKEEVLFAINTDKGNLETCIAPYFLRATLGIELKLDPVTTFDEESIYKYTISTSALEKLNIKIEERPLLINTVYDGEDCYTPARGSRVMIGSPNTHYPTSSTGIPLTTNVENLLIKSDELCLSLMELNQIFALTFNDSILFCTRDKLNKMIQILDDLKNDYSDPKKALWKQIISNYHSKGGNDYLELYETFEINFPWMMESKGRLKHVFTRVKEWNPDRKTISI